jgi:segregation and condensation protein B
LPRRICNKQQILTPKHQNTKTPKHQNTKTPKHQNTKTPKHQNTKTPLMEFLKQHIEALIFASPQPVALVDLKAVMEEAFQAEIMVEDILKSIESSKAQYQQELFPFELVEIAGGYQFLTKGAYHTSVAIHLRQATKKRLSQAALETLAIIAYKQPVSRPEVEEIRGVNCDYALQKLLEKELVFIAGRSDGPGRPLLYGTTEKFMDYLGINSLTDLPKPKDFKEIDNTVGDTPALEESSN